jgi:hypothetical protein
VRHVGRLPASMITPDRRPDTDARLDDLGDIRILLGV